MDISERISIVEDIVKKVKKLEEDINGLKNFIKQLDNSMSPNVRNYSKFITHEKKLLKIGINTRYVLGNHAYDETFKLPTSLIPRIIEWAKEELDEKLEELKNMLIREE